MSDHDLRHLRCRVFFCRSPSQPAEVSHSQRHPGLRSDAASGRCPDSQVEQGGVALSDLSLPL
eukprot:4351346-Pyramimonas_sp.AAC.1